MGKTGKDHGFSLDIIPVVFSGAGAEIFQDHRAVPDICCKITDAIPPLTQTFFYMVFPCFPEKNHEFTGLPHSGQNLEPGGTGFPQLVQNAAVFILAPQERQNLEPAGTWVPQFGHI